MNGPTGLDYVALFAVMEHMAVADEDRHCLFSDIRVMEAAALTQMNKKQ